MTRRTGFTLIELAVVMGVIMSLSAMLIVALAGQVARNKEQTTKVLLETIAAAIERHGSSIVRVKIGDALRNRWDFNADGLLDGDPAYDPGFSADDISAAKIGNYRGPYMDLPLSSLSKSLINANSRRIQDSWGNYLRVTHDNYERFGTLGLGIYSIGANGIDEQGAGDDISTWTPNGKDQVK